jgi:hypothetical protein
MTLLQDILDLLALMISQDPTIDNIGADDADIDVA